MELEDKGFVGEKMVSWTGLGNVFKLVLILLQVQPSKLGFLSRELILNL